LTEEEFCVRVGIEENTFRLWVDEGWLMPHAGDAGHVLSDLDIARARLIRDLRDNIGVNDEGTGIILNLIDQVHGLRSILQALLDQSSLAKGSGKS
jgi:chaperone modulatory protein CbpM